MWPVLHESHREAFRVWGLARYQRLLAGIGRVAIDALLIAVQQVWQGMFVVDVGCGDGCAVHQSALAVQTDVQLHPEAPLLALFGLVHLGVSGFVCILGGARCSNDGGVHNGAGIDLEASDLQLLPDFRKQVFSQFVFIEQLTNFSMVVESGTGSRPRSIPTKFRRLALS